MLYFWHRCERCPNGGPGNLEKYEQVFFVVRYAPREASGCFLEWLQWEGGSGCGAAVIALYLFLWLCSPALTQLCLAVPLKGSKVVSALESNVEINSKEDFCLGKSSVTCLFQAVFCERFPALSGFFSNHLAQWLIKFFFFLNLQWQIQALPF